MIVFCPNCGTQTTGLPGARATCSACASTFEVPFDAPGPRTAPAPAAPPVAGPPPPPAPLPGFQAPGAQVFAPPVTRRGAARTNTLAVVSLVAGILCCLPLVSPVVAIGCGAMALGQIKANPAVEGGRGLAIAGIILGVMSVVLQLLWAIGASKHW